MPNIKSELQNPSKRFDCRPKIKIPREPRSVGVLVVVSKKHETMDLQNLKESMPLLGPFPIFAFQGLSLKRPQHKQSQRSLEGNF